MKLADRLAAWANHVANDEYEMCTQAADLLDECEMLISGLECRCDGMNRCARCVTLDKLRGQEKDR